MSMLATWSMAIWKRLWKKPLFVFSLLLIPLFVWGLQLAFHTDDAIMKVALFCDDPDTEKGDDSPKGEMIQNLLSHNSNTVKFYLCDSVEELEHDVKANRADCGYIFPENMTALLAEHITTRQPVITRYRSSSELTSRLIDELVYSELYSIYSYEMVKQHIKSQTGSVDETLLYSLYNQYLTDNTFIEYEYMDGTKNKVLSDDNTNYTLLPIRGMTAVFILLAGLTGSLFWSIDKERHVFVWLKSGSHRIKLLYLFIPAGLGGVLGIYAVSTAGFAASLSGEIAAMFCYIIAVAGFCDFVGSLVTGSTAYLAIIPIATAGSVLLSPVFVDLTSVVPAIRPLRWLTPVTHYLLGLYNTYGRLQLLLYGTAGILLSHIIRKVKYPA